MAQWAVWVNALFAQPLNHLKALSGVPLIPQIYGRLLGYDKTRPAKAFLQSPEVSVEVKESWLAVIEPKSCEDLLDISATGGALARNCL
jgi:hypothetical protein